MSGPDELLKLRAELAAEREARTVPVPAPDYPCDCAECKAIRGEAEPPPDSLAGLARRVKRLECDADYARELDEIEERDARAQRRERRALARGFIAGGCLVTLLVAAIVYQAGR